MLLLRGGVEQNPGPTGPASDWSPETALDNWECDAFEWIALHQFDHGPSSSSGWEEVGNRHQFRCKICNASLMVRDAWELKVHLSTACLDQLPLGDATPAKTPDTVRMLLLRGGVEQNPGPTNYGYAVFSQLRSWPTPSVSQGRGAALLTCGDIESNPGPSPHSAKKSSARPNPRPFVCPFTDCEWQATSTKPPLLKHLNSVHLSAGQSPSTVWLGQMEVWCCSTCKTIQGLTTPCARSHQVLPLDTPRSSPVSMDKPEPTVGPSVAEILELRLPTIRHIPQGARAAVGRALGTLLRDSVVSPSWDATRRLFLLPKYVLQTPGRWGKRHRRANTKQIIDRASAIVDLPLERIWKSLSEDKGNSRPVRKKRHRDADSGTLEEYDGVLEAQVQALLSEGALGKAAKHLTSEGIHDVSSIGVLDTLKSLHPQPLEGPSVPLGLNAGEPLIDDDGDRRLRVKRAILSFPAGSACGPSGLRPRHLQDILQGDHQGTSTLFQGFALLCEAAETGTLHPKLAQWLCCATLIPLKKSSGNGVRPVAVGETARRVVEKVLMALPLTTECVENMRPLQVGQGLSGASELMGRSLQQMLDFSTPPRDWGILQLDLSNAFNSVDRTAVLKGVQKWAPHLGPWATLSLQSSATLFSALGRLSSAQGVQQGSPLGPLFFNVAIQDILKACPGALDWNIWYMDDGTLVGPATALEQALNFLPGALHVIGLEMNMKKCTLWGPLVDHLADHAGNQSPLSQVTHIPWKNGSGVVLLGVPIHFPGDPTFTRNYFEGVLNKVKQSCSVLVAKLRDSQTQLALLRGCFAACKFTFLLRSTQIASVKDILQKADATLREAFEAILGAPVSDSQWIQATLSFAEGGLGIESPLVQAPAAALAGLTRWSEKSTALRPKGAPGQGLTGVAETLAWLREHVGESQEPLSTWAAQGRFSAVEKEHMDQNYWSGLIHKRRKQALLQDSPARDIVRLKCQDSADAAAWSRAPPCAAFGTKIPRETYQVIIRWHLGMPLLAASCAGKPCPSCGDACDIFGDHAVTCLKSSLWKRHFLLQDFMLRLTRAAGFQASREQSLLSTDRREGDIWIQNWDGTKPVAIDLTVRHPRAPGSAMSDAEGSLLRAEKEKRLGASARAELAGAQFEPLVFHTWSGVPNSGSSKTFLGQWMSRVVENRPGVDKDRKVREIKEGLSCILMAQVAEQLQRVQDSREIPVLPNLRIPDFVDEAGNETGILGLNSRGQVEGGPEAKRTRPVGKMSVGISGSSQSSNSFSGSTSSPQANAPSGSPVQGQASLAVNTDPVVHHEAGSSSAVLQVTQDIWGSFPQHALMDLDPIPPLWGQSMVPDPDLLMTLQHLLTDMMNTGGSGDPPSVPP